MDNRGLAMVTGVLLGIAGCGEDDGSSPCGAVAWPFEAAPIPGSYGAARASAIAQCREDGTFEVYDGTCGSVRFLQVTWTLGHAFAAFDSAGRLSSAWKVGDIGDTQTCGSLPACADSLPYGPPAIGRNLCADCDEALEPAVAATWTDLAVQASATQACAVGGAAWRGACGGVSYVVKDLGTSRTNWLFDSKGALVSVVEWNTGAMPLTCWRFTRGTPPAASLCGSWWTAWTGPAPEDTVLCKSPRWKP